jgi:hypothetical protein
MTAESGDWSPYLVGALIGLLSMATFYLSNKPLSVSTAYARLAGLVGEQFSKEHTRQLPYFEDTKPKIEWGVMLLSGMLLGGFFAAVSGGVFDIAWVPALWIDRFGPEVAPRLAVAFVGGVFLAFGARLAGGCTSGHGISGALQLSVGSWIALSCFFVAAIVTAHLLYRS